MAGNLWRGGENDFDVQFRSITQDGDGNFVPDLLVVVDDAEDVALSHYVGAFYRDENILNVGAAPSVIGDGFDSCTCSTTAADDSSNHQSELRKMLHTHPDVRLDDLAVLDELGDNAIDGIDGNGKADSGAGAGGTEDGCIHSDQASGAVDERTAGVAGIDCCVGLNHSLDRVLVRRLNFATQSADNSRGAGVVKPERVADHHDVLANLEIGTFSDSDGRQFFWWGIDLQDGDVFIVFVSYKLCFPCGAVHKGDIRSVAVGDHVQIGDYVASLVPNET